MCVCAYKIYRYIIFFIILHSNFSKRSPITKSALAIQYFYVLNFASSACKQTDLSRRSASLNKLWA